MKGLGFITLLTLKVIIGYGQPAVLDSLSIPQELLERGSGIHINRNFAVLSEERIKYLLKEDTTIRVKYIKNDLEHIQPAYYINGLFVNNLALAAISPSTIEKLSVETGEFEKYNKKYSGKLHIKLKDWVEFKPITIKDLKKKYLDLSVQGSIITIDNKVVYDDYNEVVINECGIYKIEVLTLQSEKEDLNMNVINLISRTEKNIKETESIRIRGEGK